MKFEIIDLIEQQDKDITAMVKQIALQETKINELERAIENETVIRTGYKSRINELEAREAAHGEALQRIEELEAALADCIDSTAKINSLNYTEWSGGDRDKRGQD